MFKRKIPNRMEFSLLLLFLLRQLSLNLVHAVIQIVYISPHPNVLLCVTVFLIKPREISGNPAEFRF